MNCRTHQKWLLLPLYTLILGTFVLSACGPSNDNRKNTRTDLRNITVAQFGDFFLYLPLYIAIDKGFFKAEGLDVSVTNTGGDEKTFAAVISGSAEFGIADPTFVAIARTRGQGGQVIASIVNGVPFWGVTKNKAVPVITDPQQLRPFTVATFPSPSTAFALQEQMFKRANLTPRIRQSAFGTLLGQLDAGTADIALELEPNVSAATKEGARVVYSMAEIYGDFAITGVSTSDELVTREPDLVQKFVNAIAKSEAFIHNSPSEALALAQKRFKELNPNVLKVAFERVLKTRTLPSTPVISEKAWTQACQLRINTGELKTTLAESKRSLNNTFALRATQKP